MKNINLDRAFPDTPECIHSAIELGLRRGRQRAKMRARYIGMASAAAALLVMIAVAAVSMGAGRTPPPDVLSQPQNSPPATETAAVYSTDGADYYHLDEHCSGMENAVPMPETEAIQMGKKPCPVCIPLTCSGHDGEAIEFVYYSQGGKFFHKQEECSDGKFELKGEYFAVTKAFPAKEPCAVCFPGGIEECLHGKAFEVEVPPTTAPAPEEYVEENESSTESMPAAEEYVSMTEKEGTSRDNTDIVYVEYGANGNSYHWLSNCGGREYLREITVKQAEKENFPPCSACYSGYVFYTENGQFYHSDEHCLDMMNASAHSREEAAGSGKIGCPWCLNVYCTDGGSFYHLFPDCIGMKNASLRSIEEARSMVKTRCATCMNPAKVYATEKGRYCHVDAECSGMKGAEPMPLDIAVVEKGKQLCPVCMPSPGDMNVSTVASKAYISDVGLYYHTMDTCGNITGMHAIDFDALEILNKIACPVCYLGLETVYATEKGNYYHAVQDCSGMEGTLAMTAADAYSKRSQHACPVCLVPLVYQTETVGTSIPQEHMYRFMPYPETGLYLSDRVYSARSDPYFHKTAGCSSFDEVEEVKLEKAVGRKQEPCTVCTKTTPDNYDLFTTAFGKEVSDLYYGYNYDHSVGNEWIISNGKESFPLCVVYPQGTAFFGEELPGFPELHLSDCLACDPEQMDVFMKTAPTPIGSMYTAAPAEIEKQLRHSRLTVEELQLIQLKIYFDANRQVSACEMQFGFGDHVNLKWQVNADGEIELIESEFVDTKWE